MRNKLYYPHGAYHIFILIGNKIKLKIKLFSLNLNIFCERVLHVWTDTRYPS
jgi:hypothetical protein